MSTEKRKTGFVSHELYMWHDTGNYSGPVPYGNPVQPDTHAENPETKRRFRNLLEVAGLTPQLTTIAPRAATEDEVLRYHTREHLENVKALSAASGGDVGPFTPIGRGSYEIAMLSVGGVLAAVEAVMEGQVDNAYALVRPPGHHALKDQGMGFCTFCNAALAGFHVFEKYGVERVAYVDWDVHHGNGTQAAFYGDPRALTISIHQDNCFPPDSGYREETGEGEGKGTSINVPLPPGSGVGAYEATMDRVVIPALHAFRPQLIVVPCGFDAGAYDPLGRMQVHSGGFRYMTQKIMDAADELCDGKLLLTHEGGYNTWSVPFFGLAVMETLSGISTETPDPFFEMASALGGQELQPHQDADITAAEALLELIPRS
ncbi:MAG: class II histone deacetylase [Pseudomonadota bacterium]